MLSNKGEQRSFGNGRLRDQWEKRAQTIADQCKQEGQLREKSSLKLLYSKWNYHWALAANGDTSKGERSDFQGVTSEEAEKNKPKIKFKIVPPPPPRPKSKAPPRPPRRASPQPLIVKRKVEVDAFRLHWKESWMCLKPPKYLFLKADEAKNQIQGFTTIEVLRDDKYKPVRRASQPECISTLDWRRSWKQVKAATPSACSGRKRFQWDIWFDRDVVPEPEIGIYQLPVWAGTWKIMNFAFRQEKQEWDREWPAFQQHFSNKVDDAQRPLERDGPPGWEDSWRLSKATVGAEDCSRFELAFETAKVNDVLLPGWNESWLISAAAREEDEEDDEKIWSSCWPFRLQLRWRKSSLQSHQRHGNLMTRRREILNSVLASEFHDANVDTAEWWDSWRTLKRWNPPEEDGPDDAAEVSELLTDAEEEDEGVHNEEEGDRSDEEATRDEGSEGDKEEDEGVDDEEEAEDTEIEYNREDVIRKTETPDGENFEIEPEEEADDPENGDEENPESEDDDEELEEDVETRETKLLNHRIDVRNQEEDEEDEDGDSGVTEDEREEKVNRRRPDDVDAREEKEEPANAVREAQVYRSISLQLKEIFRMITNKREKDEEETDEGKDRASTKTRAYLQDEEEGEEGGEDEIEEEVEEKDFTRDIEDADDAQEGSLGEDQRAEEATVKTHQEAALKKEDDADEERENKCRKSIRRKAKVPLHLRFHKANASLSSWTRSWMVAVAHRRSHGEDEANRADGGQERVKAWRESWRICYRRKPLEDEVASFSAEHRRVRGFMDEDDGPLKTKWTLSWKMTKKGEDMTKSP